LEKRTAGNRIHIDVFYAVLIGLAVGGLISYMLTEYYTGNGQEVLLWALSAKLLDRCREQILSLVYH